MSKNGGSNERKKASEQEQERERERERVDVRTLYPLRRRRLDRLLTHKKVCTTRQTRARALSDWW